MKIYSRDIEMEFGLEKCAMLRIRGGKRQITEGIELTNQERIRTLEEENYKNFGILETDSTEQVEMKGKKKGMSTFGKRENFSKPSSAVEISSNE